MVVVGGAPRTRPAWVWLWLKAFNHRLPNVCVDVIYCWNPFRFFHWVTSQKSPRINFDSSGEICSRLFNEFMMCSVAVAARSGMNRSQNEKRLLKFPGKLVGGELETAKSSALFPSWRSIPVHISAWWPDLLALWPNKGLWWTYKWWNWYYLRNVECTQSGFWRCLWLGYRRNETMENNVNVNSHNPSPFPRNVEI